MRVGSPAVRIAISGATVITSLVAVTPAAQARLDCGSWGLYYVITSSKGVHLPFPGTHKKDGRGGKITVSVSKASTVTSQWGTTVEAEIGALFAKVKSEVNHSSVRSTTSTVGHSYSHRVSPNRYGNVAYGAWANRVSWQAIYRWSNCSEELQSSGVATVVTEAHGFRYWETPS